MTDHQHVKATTRDVAHRAGVSPGTVSKVMNGQGKFRLTTRQRIFTAARELGFRPPHLRVDSLATDAVTIGILTSDIYGRFTLPIMVGAGEALGTGAVSAVMCESSGDLKQEQFYLRFLFYQRVDAVIVAGRSPEPRPSLGRELPFPILYAYQPSDDLADCSIIPDHAAVSRTAIRHLLARGRSRMAHVTGPPGRLTVQERSDAAAEELGKHDLAFIRPPLAGEWSESWGRQAVDILEREGARFDGVYCASDEIARGVVTRLRELGYDVPNGISVIGVDNWIPLVEASQPPLSSIDLNLNALGNTAAKMLDATIRGTARLERGIHRFPISLVERKST